MKTKRQPDWFDSVGAYWFEEMFLKQGYHLNRVIKLELQADKLCYLDPDTKRYIFPNDLAQKRFDQWRRYKAEQILLGVDSEV